MKLDDSIKIIKLIDSYGKLLTNRQLEIITDYYFNNLTLSEIGDNYNISRQAVKDSISQSVKALQLYEEKLHVISKEDSVISDLTQIVQDYSDDLLKERLIKIIENLRG